MNNFDINFTKVTLKKFRFALIQEMTQRGLKDSDIDIWVDRMTKNIVARIERSVYGHVMETIKYPENWKEAVKEAFYNWLHVQCKKLGEGRICSKSFYIRASIVTKYPVKYKAYDAVMYYPAIPEQEHKFSFVSVNN